jgi:hypothetical protein
MVSTASSSTVSNLNIVDIFEGSVGFEVITWMVMKI